MYKLEVNRCDCHPETCCCAPYRIVIEGSDTVVATGDGKAQLTRLVQAANYGLAAKKIMGESI
jgi:hypothetical protein